MLFPFIRLIDNVIYLINLGLIVWLVLDVLIRLDIINRYSPIVQRVHSTLGSVFEPMLRPFRRLLSGIFPNLTIDISPILLILLLDFIADAVHSWL